jgi:hypothetical protein
LLWYSYPTCGDADYCPHEGMIIMKTIAIMIANAYSQGFEPSVVKEVFYQCQPNYEHYDVGYDDSES